MISNMIFFRQHEWKSCTFMDRGRDRCYKHLSENRILRPDKRQLRAVNKSSLQKVYHQTSNLLSKA